MKIKGYLVIIFAIGIYLATKSVCYANLINSDSINLPHKLGANNFGTKFIFSIPPCNETDKNDTSNKVRFFIYSYTRTYVKLSIEANNYILQDTVYANKYVEFSVESSIAQPYQKSWTEKSSNDTIFAKKGIVIEADNPVVVYAMVKYRSSADGFLAIPVSSLGNEYIASPYAQSKATNNVEKFNLPGTINIVAAFDSTNIIYTIGGNDSTVTQSGTKIGESKNIQLMAGDVFVLNTGGAGSDLSGTKIVSDKPIAVISGNYCANIPIYNPYCDYTVEMNMPCYSYGKTYPVPIISKRKYSPVIRIFSISPQTNIYRDNNKLCVLDGSGVEGKGWLEMRLNLDTINPKPVVISSENQIYITFYNTGNYEDDNADLDSDPFLMNIIPSEQYNDELYFIIPNEKNTNYFKDNYLSVVSVKAKDNETFNLMKCKNIDSTDIGNRTLNELFYVDSIKFTDNSNYILYNLTLWDRGLFKINSESLFLGYLYGNGYLDAYGLPASSLFVDYLKNDFQAPIVTITQYKGNDSISYDYQVIKGIVNDDPNNVRNQSNLSLMFLLNEYSSNYKFSHNEIIPGITQLGVWQLDVIDTSKNAQAVLFFSDRCGNDTIITFNYERTLGVNDDNNNVNISLYPNPASDKLNIIFKNNNYDPVRLNIINAQGIIVKEIEYRQLNNNLINIDIADLSNGDYIVEVIQNKYIKDMKFSIIK